MNRKVTVVGGAGNVGATVARAIADKELADVVIIDIADQKAKGVALDMYRGVPDRGIGLAHHRRRGRRGGMEGDGEFRRRRHHLGRAAEAGHEPRRPAARQLQDHAVGDRAGRQVFAQLHHRPGRQPARRDVPGGLPAQQVPARAGDRHGRRARLGAHADVHRDGDRRLGGEHPRLRARRARRHDGAAAALLDDRRHSAAGLPGSDGGDDRRRSASGRRAAAPRSPSWSGRARGTRPDPPRPRWSRSS